MPPFFHRPLPFAAFLISLMGVSNSIGASSIAVTVDANRSRAAINPAIYGLAFASSNDLGTLNIPFHRSGGNAESRYNWQINAHNRGMDWYFESLADSSATPAAETDAFVADSRAAGAQPMLTMPMVGWVAKLGTGRLRLASFSIAKYGTQTANDWQYFPDAGNGISSSGGAYVTGNDPADANVAVGSAFQVGWLQHLTNRWGLPVAGGPRYFLLDNEHSIWHSSHRDVHPYGATMTEIRDKMIDYAGKIKATVPGAVVLGPEEWGWSGYLYSGYDQQMGSSNGWSSLPDRIAHGNMDYMPWLLDQLRRTNAATGQRLLDYFSLHFYPQSGEFGNDVSTSMQLLRNRSTRALWDSNYVDQSWIGTTVKLIPRMKQWVATYYPGTLIGLTEYNWGAENHINGATAQADLLGIFGREGLDLAVRWTTPPSGSPVFNAIKMYRNYDGNKSTFGNTRVYTSGGNSDNLSQFAALRSSDGALTVMLVHKFLSGATNVALTITNFFGTGSVQRWELTGANVITRLADLTNAPGSPLSVTLPAQSVTLLVAAPGRMQLQNAKNRADGNMEFSLSAPPAQRYVIEGSTNLSNWSAIATNIAASNSIPYLVGRTNPPYRFFRAVWNN